VPPIEVQIISDFICPWCWIGHRRLAEGIELANLPVRPEVRYVPHEINPAMPLEGMSRRQYRSAKFGSWARSQAMDAEVALTGKGLGTEFNFDRVDLTPNTRLAHRLMLFANSRGGARNSEALLESLFAAYFADGRDIGSLDVLVTLAAATGLDPKEARDYLSGSEGEKEVVAASAQALSDGIRSLPIVRIDGTQVSGAQPATVLAQALRTAAFQSSSSIDRSTH
jgi:predicted DsbA family dithiol-disulfide isomerase